MKPGSSFDTYFALPKARNDYRQRITDTIYHEATHQIAYNAGLHHRTSENPRWVVEGLAMTFESKGNRANYRGGKPISRVNLNRYIAFKNYVSSSRPKFHLEKFLVEETLFETSTLDAYAESWALTFYLIETRPADYARYLRAMTERSEFTLYPGKKRLADFKAAFGNNTRLLEAQYLRFIERLE